MSLLRSALALALASGLAPAISLAESPPAAPSPASPTVKFTGLVDSYYGANLDHSQTVADPIRAFDGIPGFRLSYVELDAAVDAGVAGLRLDLGFAPAALPTTNFFVQQGYATTRLGPVTLDFGRFVTSAGAEVIEAKDDWLYSRSVLFTWAIPFAHTGARLTIPLTKTLTLGLSIVNGWDDDALTNPTSGGIVRIASALGTGSFRFGPQKVGMFTLAYANGPLTANVDVHAGQEQTDPDFRTLVDVVAGYTVGDLALNLNGDFGDEAGKKWYGVSAMARYKLWEDRFRATVRGEWFDDANGFRVNQFVTPVAGVPGTTGLAAKYWEATLGGSVPVGGNAELRAEYRYDGANEPVYNGVKHFNTFELAALAWF